MDIIKDLQKLGFGYVSVLDGASLELPYRRVILCFYFYQAAKEDPLIREAVIHPYYPASQKAYRSIQTLKEEYRQAGIVLDDRADIRLKPVFLKLPFLRRGMNTLSYFEKEGSRFHVQVLTCNEAIPVTHIPDTEERSLSCRDCGRCMRACPGGAIREDGFDREKCLRWWMLNGRVPPEGIFRKMGNRLIGCDICESVCPYNHPAVTAPVMISLKQLLSRDPSLDLSGMIGKNYAIANRILIQSCAVAGCCHRTDLAPLIGQMHEESMSPAVRQAAVFALTMLHEEETEQEQQGKEI